MMVTLVMFKEIFSTDVTEIWEMWSLIGYSRVSAVSPFFALQVSAAWPQCAATWQGWICCTGCRCSPTRWTALWAGLSTWHSFPHRCTWWLLRCWCGRHGATVRTITAWLPTGWHSLGALPCVSLITRFDSKMHFIMISEEQDVG